MKYVTPTEPLVLGVNCVLAATDALIILGAQVAQRCPLSIGVVVV